MPRKKNTIRDPRPVGIYIIFNSRGFPSYAGKSIDPDNRCKRHIREHKFASFYFIAEWTTSALYPERERYWIQILRCVGYKLKNGNDGGGGPVRLTKKQRQHIRKLNLGRKQSEATKEKHRNNWKRRKDSGWEMPKEQRDNISKGNTGKVHSKQTRKLIKQNSLSQWERQHKEGYEVSEQHKQNTSKAIKAKWQEPKHRENHAASQSRGPLSKKHVAGLKRGWKGRRERYGATGFRKPKDE